MGDIPTRARGFQYSRHTSQTTPLEQLSIVESMQSGWEMARLLASSRGSSLNLNSGRANATSFQSTDPISRMRDLDRVWHNPNTDQLAETLKVVIMTHGCCEPVPVHYNSCILHVLEAYHDMRLELGSKTRELEDARGEIELATSELKEKNLLWEQKEIDYKAEIKKLEVILAGGQRGLELVTLARSNSALHREKRAAEAKAGYNDQIHHEDDVDATTVAGLGKEIMVVDFSAQKDSRLSRSFMPPYAIAGFLRGPTSDSPQAREQHHYYGEMAAEISGYVLPKTSPVENPRGKENALGISDGDVPPSDTSRSQRFGAHASSSNRHLVSTDGLLSEQSQNTSRGTRYFGGRRKGGSWSNTSTVLRGNLGQNMAQVELPQAESDSRQKNTVGDIEAALAAARRR